MDEIIKQIPTVLETVKIVDEMAEWFSNPFSAILTVLSAISFGFAVYQFFKKYS